MPALDRDNLAFRTSLQRVERRMRTRLRSRDAGVNRVLTAAMGRGGKRIRAQVTLLAGRLSGARGADLENLAAAVELFHLATLVHDDIIDRSDRRRHRPALRSRFGDATAVLAGDLVLTRVISMLLDGLPDAVTRVLVEASASVCQGEIQELQHQQDWSLSAAAYVRIIEHKTAALFAASAEAGARMGQAGARMCENLGRYGRALGMAFQIQDDLIDLLGDPSRSGKEAGQDIQEGRVTLPVILGLKMCPRRDAKTLRHALEVGQSRQAATLLQACGAVARTRVLLERYVRQAERALETCPAGFARKALVVLARQSGARTH